MIFLSRDHELARTAKRTLMDQIEARNLKVDGWRKVPVNPDACGSDATKSMPDIEQIYVTAPKHMDTAEFNRNLFVARRRAEIELRDSDPDFFVCSLSADVILYKGLMMPSRLPEFYEDLNDPNLKSRIAVFHQRFSTNTMPQWRLAQPFRYLAHNGEINTIRGNRNWANARAAKFHSELLPELPDLQPMVSMSGSDSMSLDNMLEVLLAGGMDIFHAMRLLLPPAWHNMNSTDPDMRAWLEYASMHMEPWDGPAGVVLTDGRYASCVLDRNGLRPARYVITRDRLLTLASEAGVCDYAADEIVAKGRVRPGQMFAVDTETGDVLQPEQIDDWLKTKRPYAKWLQKHSRHLRSRLRDTPPSTPVMDDKSLLTQEKMFGVSFEERDQVVRVLAEEAQEAVGSMGDDTPFPVLSTRTRSLYENFRQQFAQVTNPPIDPLREAIVMSLETCLGVEQNIFKETVDHARRLLVRSPILSREKFETLLAMDDEPEYRHRLIDLNFDPTEKDLQQAIEDIANEAVNAVKNETVVIVLSDRQLQPNRLPVHALLAPRTGCR